MRCIEVLAAQTAHPTGDPKFAVQQPFPAAISAEQADPFLMCDEFGPTVSTGREEDPDSFPIAWHPHIGMDIMTYLRQGRGRHADSLGNREEFESPGFQWCSVGSGIMHAEGGGDSEGSMQHGFQIWVNVPKDRKNDDPRYGTEPPENVPLLQYPQVVARLLAGEVGEARGPFQTVQPVQMIDFELEPGAEHSHSVPPELDNAMLYVYQGSGRVAGQAITGQRIARFCADDPASREIQIISGTEGLKAIFFAGKRINEPIVWHGPFVMSSRADLQQAFRTFQSGDFPPKRVPWDYERLDAFPADKRPQAA